MMKDKNLDIFSRSRKRAGSIPSRRYIDLAANEKGDTLLSIAVQLGYSDMIQLLCDEHAEINCKNKNGDTPLHLATLGGRKKIVSYLINKGAKNNQQNKQKLVPLDIALNKKPQDWELVELLVDKDIDIGIEDSVDD